MFLRVTNNGTAIFTAKFDGTPYVFNPKRPVTISADAARHIFGIGASDKTEVLTRHGWLSHSSGTEAAMTRLGEFSFDIPDNIPDDVPHVELTTMDKVEEKEQGSAPLQLGGGKEAGQLNGEPDELLPPISTRGGILDGLKNFLK